jgi:hypothetical protein
VRYSSGYHAAAVTRQVAPSALSSLRLMVSTLQQDGDPSALTEIDVASSAGIQPKCGIAGWALLSLKLADVFVEASFVGHMTTRQLQYAFASEGVFQRLLTHGAVAAYVGPLSSGARPLDIEDGGHASSTVQRSLSLAVDAAVVSLSVRGEGLRGGGRVVGAARARSQSS